MLWFCDIEPRNKRTDKQTIDELKYQKLIKTALFYVMTTLEKPYVYSLQTKHNEKYGEIRKFVFGLCFGAVLPNSIALN